MYTSLRGKEESVGCGVNERKEGVNLLSLK
jgi:hypothetical protein